MKTLCKTLIVCLMLSFFACSEEDVLDNEIRSVQLCTNLNANDKCSSDLDLFSPDTPTIYAAASINATERTTITYIWTFLDSDFEIDRASVSLTDLSDGPSFKFSGFLSRPTNGWPVGLYEVRVEMEGGNTVTKRFEVQ